MTHPLPIVGSEGSWWITGIPGDELSGPCNDQQCGPYDTRAEAEADRVGLRRFLIDQDAGRNPFE